MPEYNRCTGNCDSFRALELLLCIACMALVFVLLNDPPTITAWPWLVVLFVVTFGGIGIMCAIDIIGRLAEDTWSLVSTIMLCIVAIWLFLISGIVCIVLYVTYDSGVIMLILGVLALLTAILFLINLIFICGMQRERKVYPGILQVANRDPSSSRTRSYSSKRAQENDTSLHDVVADGRGDKAEPTPQEPPKHSEPQIIYVNPAMEKRKSSPTTPKHLATVHCLHYLDDYDSHSHISYINDETQTSDAHYEPVPKTHSGRTVRMKRSDECIASHTGRSVHSNKTEEILTVTGESKDGVLVQSKSESKLQMVVYRSPQSVSSPESRPTSPPDSQIESVSPTSGGTESVSPSSEGLQIATIGGQPSRSSHIESIKRQASQSIQTIPGSDDRILETLDVIVKTTDFYVRVASTKDIPSTGASRTYRKPRMVSVRDNAPSDVHRSDAHDDWGGPSTPATSRAEVATEATQTDEQCLCREINEEHRDETLQITPPTSCCGLQKTQEKPRVRIEKPRKGDCKRCTPVCECPVHKNPCEKNQGNLRKTDDRPDTVSVTPATHQENVPARRKNHSNIPPANSMVSKKESTPTTEQENIPTRTKSHSYIAPASSVVSKKESTPTTEQENIPTTTESHSYIAPANSMESKKESTPTTEQENIPTRTEQYIAPASCVVSKKESTQIDDESVEKEEDIQDEKYIFKEIIEFERGPEISITARRTYSKVKAHRVSPSEHNLLIEDLSEAPSLPDSTVSTGQTFPSVSEPILPDENALVQKKVANKCPCHYHDIRNDKDTVKDVSPPAKDTLVEKMSSKTRSERTDNQNAVRKPTTRHYNKATSDKATSITTNDISLVQNNENVTPKSDVSKNVSQKLVDTIQADNITESHDRTVSKSVSFSNRNRNSKKESKQRIETTTSVEEKSIDLEEAHDLEGDTLTRPTSSSSSSSSHPAGSAAVPITTNQIRQVETTKTNCCCYNNDLQQNRSSQKENLANKERPRSVPIARTKLRQTIKVDAPVENNAFSSTQIRYRYDLRVGHEPTKIIPPPTTTTLRELRDNEPIASTDDGRASEKSDKDEKDSLAGKTPQDSNQGEKTETPNNGTETKASEDLLTKQESDTKDTKPENTVPTQNSLMEEKLENDLNDNFESISQGEEQCNCRNSESETQECNCICPCCKRTQSPKSDESDVPENWRKLELPESGRSKTSSSPRSQDPNLSTSCHEKHNHHSHRYDCGSSSRTTSTTSSSKHPSSKIPISSHSLNKHASGIPPMSSKFSFKQETSKTPQSSNSSFKQARGQTAPSYQSSFNSASSKTPMRSQMSLKQENHKTPESSQSSFKHVSSQTPLSYHSSFYNASGKTPMSSQGSLKHEEGETPLSSQRSEDQSMNNLLNSKSSKSSTDQNGNDSTSTITAASSIKDEKDVDDLIDELEEMQSSNLLEKSSTPITPRTDSTEITTTETPSSSIQQITPEVTATTGMSRDPSLYSAAESGNIEVETDNKKATLLKTDNDSQETIIGISKQRARSLERKSKDSSNKRGAGPKIPVRHTKGSKTVRTSTVTKVTDRYVSSYGGVFPVSKDIAPMAHSTLDNMRSRSTRRSETPPMWQRARPCPPRQCYTTRPTPSQNNDDIPVRGLVLPSPPCTPGGPLVQPCQHQSAMTSPYRPRVPHDEIPVRGLPNTDCFFAPSARVCQRCSRYHDPGSQRSQVTVPVMCPNFHVHGTVDVDLTRGSPSQYTGRISNYQDRSLPPPESYNRYLTSPTPYVIPPDNTCAKIVCHETLRRQYLSPTPPPMPSPTVFILGRTNVEHAKYGQQPFYTPDSAQDDYSCSKIREINDEDDEFFPTTNETTDMRSQYNDIATNIFGSVWRETEKTQKRVETQTSSGGRESRNRTTVKEMYQTPHEDTGTESFSSMEEEPSENDLINYNSEISLNEGKRFPDKRRSLNSSAIHGESRLDKLRIPIGVATMVPVEPFIRNSQLTPVHKSEKSNSQRSDTSQASTSSSKPRR